MYKIILACFLLCSSCSSVATEELKSNSWEIKPAKENKSILDCPVNIGSKCIFFPPNKMVLKQDAIGNVFPNIKMKKIAYMGISLSSLYGRLWDQTSDRLIWNKSGITYFEISFPGSQNSTIHMFQVNLDIDNNKYLDVPMWSKVWGEGTAIQFYRRSIGIYWSSLMFEKEYILKNHTKMHLKVWNTDSGVVIDKIYPISWRVESGVLTTTCEDLGDAPLRPKCNKF